MALKLVRQEAVILGADPEFFFENKQGAVIGAEKVIPKEGISEGDSGKVIIDGVQAELNPSPSSCREILQSNIYRCLNTMHNQLKNNKIDVSTSFKQAIEISEENLAELSDESRVFGCSPSKTAYRRSGIKIESVDPMQYRVRAAGGHIHLGIPDGMPRDIGIGRALTTDVKKTVEMLDILCGNTCVLLDRDPANIERRKLYGKAGEYRTPKHGLEYRTLSNFWLMHPALLSFAFGMARLATDLMADEANYESYYAAFTGAVDMKKIRKAINTNDYDLAYQNFMAIKDLILEVTNISQLKKPRSVKQVTYSEGRYPITLSSITETLWLFDKVHKDGLASIFPKLGDYRTFANGPNHRGYHGFLADIVTPLMIKEQAALNPPSAPEAAPAAVKVATPTPVAPEPVKPTHQKLDNGLTLVFA